MEILAYKPIQKMLIFLIWIILVASTFAIIPVDLIVGSAQSM